LKLLIISTAITVTRCSVHDTINVFGAVLFRFNTWTDLNSSAVLYQISGTNDSVVYKPLYIRNDTSNGFTSIARTNDVLYASLFTWTQVWHVVSISLVNGSVIDDVAIASADFWIDLLFVNPNNQLQIVTNTDVGLFENNRYIPQRSLASRVVWLADSFYDGENLLGVPLLKQHGKLVDHLGTFEIDLSSGNKSQPCIRNPPTSKLRTFYAPGRPLMITGDEDGVHVFLLDLWLCNSYPLLTIPTQQLTLFSPLSRSAFPGQSVLFEVASFDLVLLKLLDKTYTTIPKPSVPAPFDYGYFTALSF